MICAISGEPAREPVISPKSGSIFEKSLIVNYISTSGKDPINDQSLTIDELIPVNTSASSFIPPKPSAFNSIPSLLSAFQNEWDSLALEVFTLRKQLHQARQELSAALYHQDAAVRVAAKAIKERDESKQALQQLAISIGEGEPIAEEVVSNENKTSQAVESTIPAAELLEAREELFQLHKSQKPVLSITPEQSISIKFDKSHIQPFRKSNTDSFNTQLKTLVIGSPTGAVAVYDFHSTGKTNVKKITHKGIVSAVSFIKFENNFVPIIAYENEVIIGDSQKVINHVHKEKVVQILTHPKINTFFILVSNDGTWSLNNESTTFFQSSAIKDITTSDLHVDGLLFCVGNTHSEIQVFDLTTGSLVSSLKTTYDNVTNIKFALNGYWLLASSKDNDGHSCLDIIDLRKNSTIHTIDFTVGIIDFIIDPSSSLIVTYDESNEFKIHRFIKKGKKWLDNLSANLKTEISTPLNSISLLTNADDESFKENNEIHFIGVGENSSVLEYEINYT